MKRKICIAISGVVCILLAFCFLLSCYSHQKIMRRIEKYSNETSIDDYMVVYEDVDTLMKNNKYQFIIDKYCYIINQNSPEEANAYLCSIKASSAIHLGKLNEFNQMLNNTIGFSTKEIEVFFNGLWRWAIVSAKTTNTINHYEIISYLNNFFYGNKESNELKDIFIYYLESFFEQNSGVDIDDYASFYNERTYYILTLLSSNDNDSFKRMFVSDYLKEPFTGADVLLAIDSGAFNREQLVLLKDALIMLDSEYNSYYPDLYSVKHKIIDNLLIALEKQLNV